MLSAILLAQGAIPAWVISWAIVIVLVLAVVGIVLVATKAMGVAIPQWLIQILGIILIAAVAIMAIKFLANI